MVETQSPYARLNLLQISDSKDWICTRLCIQLQAIIRQLQAIIYTMYQIIPCDDVTIATSFSELRKGSPRLD